MEADGSERDAEVNRPREESKTVPGRSAHLMMMMMMMMIMIMMMMIMILAMTTRNENC